MITQILLPLTTAPKLSPLTYVLIRTYMGSYA